MKSRVRRLLAKWLGRDVDVQVSSVNGGDSHACYRAEYDDQNGNRCAVFIKVNTLAHQSVLHSEYQSLLHFNRYVDLHYPRPLLYRVDDEYAYLVLTHHHIQPLGERTSTLAAKALVQQHLITSDKFGWSEGNHIGTTPQSNAASESWPDFFRDQRLMPQLALAVERGLSSTSIRNIEFICDQIGNLLSERDIQPRLLHGDLWSGNIGFDEGSEKPIFYDPAPYFGDPEVDLAMTRLFGGFRPGFYQIYYAEAVEFEAAENVQSVYNIYHSLNHFNIFGHNYQTLVDRLIYQTGFDSQLTISVKTS